jgi:solute carrier family 25 (mitochondrial folate transporter), member 32
LSSYGNVKDMIQVYRGKNRLTSLDYFAASGVSGIITAVLTNPIWVIKTRMLSTGRNAPGAYTSMSHGISEILRKEGVRGFWRGLIPSLFGISHGAVQFAAYEQLKNRRKRQLNGKELSNWDYLTTSGASKIFAGTITYPYQVVRVRLQSYDASNTYSGARHAVTEIWKHEGVRGFYKGCVFSLLTCISLTCRLAPNIFRVLPSTCITFLVYENTKFYLPRLYNDEDLKT